VISGPAAQVPATRSDWLIEILLFPEKPLPRLALTGPGSETRLRMIHSKWGKKVSGQSPVRAISHNAIVHNVLVPNQTLIAAWVASVNPSSHVP
jgi:hypothetical protein